MAHFCFGLVAMNDGGQVVAVAATDATQALTLDKIVAYWGIAPRCFCAKLCNQKKEVVEKPKKEERVVTHRQYPYLLLLHCNG